LENNIGVSIILGTGSIIALGQDEKINKTKSGIGYILGEVGSVPYIGKRLVQDFLNDKFPKKLLSF